MARGLKTRGLLELKSLRDRTRRQYALGRIYRDDCEFICEYLDIVEARITSMYERGDTHGE